MNETKERILDVSLSLFSEKGYSAVSIRDICKEVAIKESSVYYHFQNKQAVFDELLRRFLDKAQGLMAEFSAQMPGAAASGGDLSYLWPCDSFFERYLMDGFCNRMMRLMLIEQFHNAEVKALYDRWMFEEPLRFQSGIFRMLMEFGVIAKGDSEYTALKYYAPIYLLAQKWLFCGALSEENKNAFRKEAYAHIRMFFAELEGI